jgi:hypothetical protein
MSFYLKKQLFTCILFFYTWTLFYQKYSNILNQKKKRQECKTGPVWEVGTSGRGVYEGKGEYGRDVMYLWIKMEK